MVYFEFLSEITDIGLRISFKESGVKFTDGPNFFCHYGPNDVKEIQSLKFEQVMSGRKWGGKKYPKKNQ